jgi:hypothetical protein
LKFYQAAELDTGKKPPISTLDLASIGAYNGRAAGRLLSAKDCLVLPSLPRKPTMRPHWREKGMRDACDLVEKSIASLVLSAVLTQGTREFGAKNRHQ